MFRCSATLIATALCGLAFAATRAAAAGAPQLTAADFGRLPASQSIALSPNGNLLAWIDNAGSKPMVVMFDLVTRAEKRRVNLPDEMTLRNLDWADDETLLIEVSLTHSTTGAERDQREWFRTLATDVSGGETRVLLQAGGNVSRVTGAYLLALRTLKPKTVIMSTLDPATMGARPPGRRDTGYGLFEVDTRTGNSTVLHHGTPSTLEWIVDPQGEAVARSEWQVDRRLYRVLYRQGQKWSEVYREEVSKDRPVLLGLASDSLALLMIGANGRERAAVWRLPLDGGAPRIVLEDPVYDVTAGMHDPYSWQPIGAWVGGPREEIRWFDPRHEERAKSLSKTFGGKNALVMGRSADQSRLLVQVATQSTPATYYLVDYKKGTADIVGEDYPTLANAKLGEVRDYTYEARDGAQIPAYLTLPPGAGEKGLPLVVLPHDGPEWHDQRSFDWVAQFLAARGYAVLQPQYRGSTGYGEQHRKAGYRQWGGVMQDDVTDGVKALIDQGFADPARVCIVGVTYGGYAALAGAAFTPELYACAASVNGVFDLPVMLGHKSRMSGEESNSLAYWKEHIGSPSDPDVIAKSPSRAAHAIRAPILLLHASDDTVVPIRQSQLMADALKKDNKPYTFTELPGEDHWLSGSEARVRVLTELDVFLATHLTGRQLQAANAPATTAAAVVPEGAPDEVVCRLEKQTGTRFKKKVCMRRNEFERRADDAQRMMKERDRKGRAGMGVETPGT